MDELKEVGSYTKSSEKDRKQGGRIVVGFGGG